MNIDFSDEDKEKIVQSVVERLVTLLYPSTQAMAERAVKGLFVGVLRERAIEQFKEILDAASFQGVTFKGHLEQMVMAPNRFPHSERPRLMEVMEQYSYQKMREWFEEIVTPHIEALKKKLTDAISGTIKVGHA